MQGNHTNCATCNDGRVQDSGENTLFWEDLSTANLIDGSFTTASATSSKCETASSVPACLPAAKLGNGNYIYVYSGGSYSVSSYLDTGINYYGISAVSSMSNNGSPYSTPGLTVQQAYAIDTKIDDGLPQYGNVTAVYLNFTLNAAAAGWAAGGNNIGAGGPWGPTTTATSGSSTTCYDNSIDPSGAPGVAGAVQHYSVEINNGANLNCALSIRFQ